MHNELRKLAAIVFADIAGYTALMQANEAQALTALDKFKSTIESLTSGHHGEVIQYYGDGCLLLFDNVNEAVGCTLRMQEVFQSQTPAVPVRIGIHAGEVVYREGNIFSDSVNLTSRIESMGVAGSVLLSKAARDQVKNKSDFSLKSLGFFDFKNVEEPLEVYALEHVNLKVPERQELSGKFKPKVPGKRRQPSLYFIAALLIVAGVFLWQLLSGSMNTTRAGDVVYGSLAVFPFQNLSGDPGLDYLADGVAESLIAGLSDQEDLRVVSRYSTFALRDSMHNLSAIQRLLNVEAILIGSVRKEADNLVLETELIRTADNTHIWGDRFQGTEGDLRKIEADMLGYVLTQVNSARNQPSGRHENIDPEAYQHYMQGRYLSFGHTEQEIDLSVEHFHRAIEIDPEFALAYAALANQKFAQARFSNTTRDELVREAKLAIRNAVELQPDLPEALLAEANIKFYYDFDWKAAESAFRKALKADPDNALINADFAFFQCAMNNYDEAVALAEKAISLDPVSVSSMHIYAWSNMYLNPAKSELEFQKIIELHPHWIWGYAKKGMAQVVQRKCQEALETFDLVEELSDGWGGELLESYLAVMYRTCGETERAAEKMNMVLNRADQLGIGDPINIAILHGGMGDLDKLVEYARQCVAIKSVNVALMQLPKDLDVFYNKPFQDLRYVALLRELGFPNN